MTAARRERAMSTMIETVALAIWRKREEGFPDRVKRCTPDNIDRATGAWQQVLVEARAAIEAMREPTEEMHDAGGKVIEDGESYPPAKPLPTLRNVWKAMIDTALSDKEGSKAAEQQQDDQDHQDQADATGGPWSPAR